MTDCDRLLQVLKDGKWHDHHELYALGMIVHSRVADLRARGHNIVLHRERVVPRFGHGRPAIVYRYRLVPALESADGTIGAGPSVASSAAGGQAGTLSPASPAGPSLDEYGVTRVAAEVNDEFPGMLLEDGAPVTVALPIEDARAELANLQRTIWGEAA